MQETRKCKQCGHVKSLELFRQYYGRGANKGKRSQSRYRTCKQCESINTKYKYLCKKPELTEEESTMRDKIEQLYEVQRSLGYKPPGSDPTPRDASVIVDSLLDEYKTKEPEVPEDMPNDMPDELRYWLNRDFLEISPDDLQEEFDEVEARYKPIIGLSDDKTPIYDTTHKVVLDKIQDRIYDYEESYWD